MEAGGTQRAGRVRRPVEGCGQQSRQMGLRGYFSHRLQHRSDPTLTEQAPKSSSSMSQSLSESGMLPHSIRGAFVINGCIELCIHPTNIYKALGKHGRRSGCGRQNKGGDAAATTSHRAWAGGVGGGGRNMSNEQHANSTGSKW